MKMRTIVIAPLVTALCLMFKANAQDHSHHTMPMPPPTPAPKPAKQDHSQHQAKPPATATPKPVTKPKSTPAPKGKAKPKVTPEPEMDHSTMDHTMPMDHSMPMEHAMPIAPGQPVTPIPAVTEADRAAAAPPSSSHPVHDNTAHSRFVFNRLEGFDGDHASGLEWEGQGWIGTDTNKLWLRTEGERAAGRTESADVEVMYGRPIARWWDVVAGVRHDFKPGPSQDYAAIGVIGLAPYKFEVDATAYVGSSGRTAARIEAEYETLLTNRLILQPLIELNLQGQNDRERGIGSGLSTIEAGLRLRYEVTRQFAPYVGVVYERAYGNTADFRQESGIEINDTRIVAGVRIWF